MPLPRPLPATAPATEASSETQSTRIDALRAALARDGVTQLVNRTTFIDRVRQAIQSHDPDFGHVLVFRQRDLSAINRQMARHLTDQWLRTTTQRLTELLSGAAGATPFMLARLNGSDFALLMPGVQHPHAVVWGERIREILLQARLPLGDGDMCRWALGLVSYTHGDKVEDLLATLDHTLMRAESAGPDRLVVGDGASLEVATGEFAWHDTLIMALEQNRFFLAAEPLNDVNGALVRHEARLMLQTEAGAPAVPPDIFFPAAVRLGLSARCDIQAVRLGLDWLVTGTGDVSVRIALPTLAQDDFVPRVHALVEARSDLAQRLILEIDAHAIAAFYPRVSALNDMLSAAGVRLGVRRLSDQLQAIAQLHTLQVAYVRMGGPFIRGLCHSPGSREIVSSVIATASALNVQVHAEDVPDAECANILTGLGLTIMRGPGLGQSVPKTSPATAQAPAEKDEPAIKRPARHRVLSDDDVLVQRVEDALTNLSVQGHLRRESGLMMSHELRTPLSTISVAAQSLEMILAGSGELVDGRIARIRRAAARMTELLDTFFNAQRDESGMLTAMPTELDAVALADHILATLRPDTAHQLVLQAPESVWAHADSSLTAVILRNLLHNAIKYSPANLPITLGVIAREGVRGPECLFTVSDEGVGMDADELEKIFDDHYRRPAHREVKGTGIGLSIARKLCEIQNGRLDAASSPGAGTCFTIVLPGLRLADEPPPGLS